MERKMGHVTVRRLGWVASAGEHSGACSLRVLSMCARYMRGLFKGTT